MSTFVAESSPCSDDVPGLIMRRRPLDEEGSRISRLFLGNIAAAAISATLVAPIVTIIDRAVVEKTSLQRSVLRNIGKQALSVLRSPFAFFSARPFGIVWTLYAVTYGVANLAETLGTAINTKHVDSMVFASTLVVNVPLGLRKDVRFVQLFGDRSRTPGPSTPIQAIVSKTAIPKIPKLGFSKYAMTAFLARDAFTIFGSFVLAPRVAAAIPDDSTLSLQAQIAITQLSIPAVIQLATAPLHMLGLDLAARPSRMAYSVRLKQVRYGLVSIAFIRAARILPAFGFGCILNGKLKGEFCKELEGDLKESHTMETT